MSPKQIILVQNSWRIAESIEPLIAELFYTKLFEIRPDLRALFSTDMDMQTSKFMATLNMIVDNLNDPVVLRPKLQKLGVRHSDYGVKDEHYQIVEEALIWALRHSLGSEFNDATEQAWLLAYRAVADAMTMADIDNVMYPC